MGVTIFTTGSLVTERDGDDREVVRITFEPDAARTYQRYELPSGALLRTSGAIGETFGRGGETVLEVISLDELSVRAAERHSLSTREAATGILEINPDAAGHPTPHVDCETVYDTSTARFKCNRVNCASACVLHDWFIYLYCTCG